MTDNTNDTVDPYQLLPDGFWERHYWAQAYAEKLWLLATAPSGTVHLIHVDEVEAGEHRPTCGVNGEQHTLSERPTNGEEATCARCRSMCKIDYWHSFSYGLFSPGDYRPPTPENEMDAWETATRNNQWVYAGERNGTIHVVHVFFAAREGTDNTKLSTDLASYSVAGYSVLCEPKNNVKFDVSMATGRAATCQHCRMIAFLDGETPEDRVEAEPLPAWSLLTLPYNVIEEDYRERLLQHRTLTRAALEAL